MSNKSKKNYQKPKNNKNKYKNHNKTKKIKRIPNKNPFYINEISQFINLNIKNNPNNLNLDESINILKSPVGSYSPTVNNELIMLKSIDREKIYNCNNELAFELKEPLQIGIPGKIYGKTCVPYYDEKAIKFLLKNLSANKHVRPNKIVPPIQSQSNCWFNTMFVSLFISDKGRKFFHFFRQLMIEGKQVDNKEIPDKLRNGFALLNYAIESCITGGSYAYILNTNAIIKDIYESIPSNYKDNLPYIKDTDEAGNPIRYYASLIHYLNNKSIQLLFIKEANEKWKEMIINNLEKQNHLPHLIILEIYDGTNKKPGMSGKTTNKPKSFFIKGAKYDLDSCIIRDTTQQHFCTSLTCEKNEMAYDGLSYHRLVPFSWKNKINTDFEWEFSGSKDSNGKPLKWNFLHGYQMLLYYRVK
jgi:hypothetical protein